MHNHVTNSADDGVPWGSSDGWKRKCS